MELFGFNIKKKESSGGSKEYDLRDHPNAINLADVKSDKAKKLLIELKQVSQQLTKKNIQQWRSAHQVALNIENPKRYQLYNHYDDALLDLHLKGAIRNRKLKVIGSPFKIVDANGIEKPELTKLLKTSWFKNFMSLALDAKFWGHSLIQFHDIIREGKLRFKKTSLVPRRHVCPEYEVLLKEISDEPKKGFDYTKPPYSIWSISVGEQDDLGELLAIVKETISKKFVLQFWDQFAELFGMPLRIGKTSSRDQKDITKIEDALADMGSAFSAVFPEGTTIDVVESAKGDAFEVYDKRIERANSEISKAVLGQTMTMDNGSSKSQAIVHEHVADEIADADGDFLKDVVNDEGLPFFRMHGFPFADTDEFIWDDTYEYTPKEMKEIEEMLLGVYEIEDKYFEEKYGIPIIGKKIKSDPTSGEVEKKKIKLIASPPEIQLCCDEHHDLGLLTLAASKTKANAVSEELIRFVWDNRNASYSLEYFNYLSQIYTDSIVRGWSQQKALKLAYKSFGDINIDYTATDWQTLQMMEINLFKFSAAKSLAAVNELNQLLPDSNTFSDFKKKARKITDKYNTNYLRSEYNLAYSTSRNAAEYHRLIKLKEDFPTWQYLTAGDARVREAHKSLHGKFFKADDPAFNSIFPPNGWGCRCYVKASSEKLTDKDYTSDKQAKELLQKSGVDKNGVSEWDRMVKGNFNKNRAKIKTVFDENKFYVKDLKAKMSLKHNGLKKFDEIKDNYTDLKLIKRDKKWADAWFKKNAMDEAVQFLDYNKRPISLLKEEFDAHTTVSYIEKGRASIIELIPDILKKPDEVYLIERVTGEYQFYYFKFYKNDALRIRVIIDDSGNKIVTWHKMDLSKLDNERKGILIKNNG